MPAQAAGPGDDSDIGQSGDASATVVNLAEKRWQKNLIGKKPNYAKVLHNAVVPLEEAPAFKDALRYDLFSLQLEVLKPLPWDKKAEFKIRRWTAGDDARYCMWLQKHGIAVQLGIATQAIQAVAERHSYHPVRDYLASLKWDGTERLKGWLPLYLGTEDSPYTQAIGPRWLISAVARVMRPGPNCKADCVLVLEGPQGIGKSTALQNLTGDGQWFTDEVRKFGSRDVAMGLAGRWICEIAELGAMNDSTVEAAKAFLSQSIDRYRPPYGRYVMDVPRQCVFAATTNKSSFLKDETGDRRFWPIHCSNIAAGELRLNRDQLWAEAYHLYQAGHVWWLETPELRALAEEQQKQRFEEDIWEPAVVKYLAGREQVTIREVLLNSALDMEEDQLGKSHKNRVGAILTSLGWVNVQVRNDKGVRERVWKNPRKA